MKVRRSRNTLFIETKTGKHFTIKETKEGRLKVEVPDDRIMYGTEEGNSGAAFILLIK